MKKVKGYVMNIAEKKNTNILLQKMILAFTVTFLCLFSFDIFVRDAHATDAPSATNPVKTPSAEVNAQLEAADAKCKSMGSQGAILVTTSTGIFSARCVGNAVNQTSCGGGGGAWIDGKENVNTGEMEPGYCQISAHRVDSATSFDCGYPANVDTFLCKMESYCWFCYAYAKVIEVMQRVANNTYEAVIGGIAGLMAAMLAIWLAIIVLRYVAVAKNEDPGDFYSDIGKALFRVAIGVVILTSGATVWEYSVSPLSSAAFEYGSLAMSNNTTAYCEASNLTAAAPQAAIEIGADEADNPVSIIGEKIIGEGANTGGILEAMNKKLMSTLGIGIVMITAAMKGGAVCLPVNHPGLFVAGVIIVIFAAWLLFFIPLKLADVIFRLGVFLILMPLFIMAWPFPLTNHFAQKGVKLLLNVMMSLLIFALLVGLCTELVSQSLKLPTNIGADISTNITELEKAYTNDLKNLIITTAIVFFSVLIFGQVGDIAGRLTDSYYPSSGFEKNAREFAQEKTSSAWRTAKAGGRLGKAVINKF